MRRHAARGNRIGLALLGLALLLAGAALAAQSLALFSRRTTPQAIYPPAAQRFVHHHHWIWWAVAAAAIIIGLVCLRWLLVQPRRQLLRRVRLDTDRTSEPGAGRTVLLGAAITDVLKDDLTALPSVRRSSAALTGSTEQPELWLTATLDTEANVARLREHLTNQLLPSLRDALNQPGLTAYLHITVTHRAQQRATRLHNPGTDPATTPTQPTP